jgi:uncharacterized protein GlcG (DUF336 family)
MTAAIIEYGAPINLELSKAVMAAAEAEALAHGLPMVIAIVDSGANLKLLQRLDHAQFGSIPVAIGKAETAVKFKRPTQAFEEALAGGGVGLRVLSIDGLVAIDGGLPLILDGKIIGGIGVSGMQPQQDGQVAAAGARALFQHE